MARGGKTARPAITAALEYVRTRDTLDVWRLDRFSRSLGQLMALMQTLQSRQIRFLSLAKAIDPDTLAVALQLYHAQTSSVQSISYPPRYCSSDVLSLIATCAVNGA